MMFLIFGVAAAPPLLYIMWFLWTRFFGAENRNKYFAEYFKDFPEFHNSKTRHVKKELFAHLQTMDSSFPEIRKRRGIRLLEIGAGSGANFEFYPQNTNLVVVDPNPFFQQYLEDSLQKFPNVKLERCVVSGAENMKDIPDNSVDVVVSTAVMCSVPDIQQAYREIRRVLVPGGKFLFMEHVIDFQTGIIKVLQVLAGSLGISQFLLNGCRPDKDIEPEIRNGGFATVEVTRFHLDLKDGVPKSFPGTYLVKPHIWGFATAPDV